MSDQHLRELERRFRESGDAIDEAAWLGARLRAGAVDRSRVELCAWLGHPPARMALGDEAPRPLQIVAAPAAPSWKPGIRLDQLLPLERYGRDAVVRGGVALAQDFLGRWPVDAAIPDRYALVVELMSALETELDPADRRAAATRFVNAIDALTPPLLPTQPFLGGPVAGFRRLASAVLIENVRGAANTLWPALRDFSLETDRVVQVLRTALVPWALGY